MRVAFTKSLPVTSCPLINHSQTLLLRLFVQAFLATVSNQRRKQLSCSAQKRNYWSSAARFHISFKRLCLNTLFAQHGRTTGDARYVLAGQEQKESQSKLKGQQGLWKGTVDGSPH